MKRFFKLYYLNAGQFKRQLNQNATINNSGKCHALFKAIITLFAALTMSPFSSSAFAADYCKFYSGNNWNDSSKKYELPASKSHSGYSWGATSKRQTGGQLKKFASAVYKNAESVRIKALDSDVVLYVFDGDHFDGKFQALRVPQGSNTFKWRFGSMRNKIRSFICQRDDFIPSNINGLTELMQNHLLPTYLVADPITAEIHDGVRTQKNRFYWLNLKRGRLSWSTLYNMCREINVCSGDQNSTYRRKYKDYLQYTYKAQGRLKADGAKYDMHINIWIQPRLTSGSLNLRQRGWKVSVSKHIWHKRIRNSIAKQVKARFDDLGSQMTAEFHSTIRGMLGTSLGNQVINDNSQLVFSHPCQYYLQRVGYPDYTFSSFQIDNFCGGNTPTSVAAPGLRLLK